MILDGDFNISSSLQKLQYLLNISIPLQYFNVSSIFQYSNLSSMFQYLLNISIHLQYFNVSSIFQYISIFQYLFNISISLQCFNASSIFQYLFNISISLQCFNGSSIFQYLFITSISLQYSNVSSPNVSSTIQKQHWHRRFSHRTMSLWQTAACRPTRRRSGSFLFLKSIFIYIFLYNIIIIRLSPRNLMESSSSSSTTHLCLPGDIWENISYNQYRW